MFQIDGSTIIMSRGDTGSVDIRATGCDFAAADRALFTVKNKDGGIVKQGAYPIQDGVFTVHFLNEETDCLAPGEYSYDVRYVVSPYYDGSGNIVNGDQVITPKKPMKLYLLPVVGEI